MCLMALLFVIHRIILCVDSLLHPARLLYGKIQKFLRYKIKRYNKNKIKSNKIQLRIISTEENILDVDDGKYLNTSY